MKISCLTVGLLTCVALLACQEPGPRARIKGDNEQDEVGVDRAGAATFDRLITSTVSRLLEPHKGEFAELKVRTLAFVDLENRTPEELGSWRDLLIDKIETGINKRRDFQVISVRFVSTVLKNMGNMPVDELFLPEKRRQFAKVIEQQKAPIQYLLFARLTSGKTQGEGATQGNYLLTLELVNVETGVATRQEEEVRKEYLGG